MKFDITNMKKVPGAVMEVKYQGLAPVDADSVGITGDLCLDGTLTNREKDILLEATLVFSYSEPCSRCLEPVKNDLNVLIRERFSTQEPEEENVLDEVYRYKGNFIDLAKTVADYLITSIPAKVLCSESCKGLCTVCGENLNNNECLCEQGRSDLKGKSAQAKADFESGIENKFESLKKFFDKKDT